MFLLIDINPLNDNILSLGVYIIGSIAYKSGWQVKILSNQEWRNHLNVDSIITEYKPRLIGISIRNIAKSGHLISHIRHFVHFSGSTTTG